MEHKPKNLKDPKAWEKAVKSNQDEYGNAAIQAAAHAMVLLDEGKTPDVAREIGFKGKGLTGFLAGAAAVEVARAHKRGDEFNKAWNKHNGAPEKTSGTINPALFTITTK